MACIFLPMMIDIAIRVSTALIIALTNQSFVPKPQEVVVSSHEISLENRYPEMYINETFKDNILLNMAYMEGKVTSKDQINWDEIRKPFQYEFRLDPNQTFAYHEDVLDEYKDKVTKTTNAHFNAGEGFRFSGFLYGDGICHLASLIYKVAKQANLDAYAPTNHDFAPIPEIEKEYGVSIYSYPGRTSANARQNLYITNNKQKSVEFRFEYQEEKLKLLIFTTPGVELGLHPR